MVTKGQAISYRNLTAKEWEEKEDFFQEMKRSCSFCARNCRVNRLEKERGFCHAPQEARIASFHLHYGEEKIISGISGSGTIFFSHCNLGCLFCQNYEIASGSEGEEYSAHQLAQIFLYLQSKGAHNINLVTPSPYLLEIVQALKLACKQGLSIPVVFNCGGYENPQAIRALAGLVAVYLPDFKFGPKPESQELAKKLAAAPDYADYAQQSITEMFNQVGPVKLDTQGVVTSGTIIRHLILPGAIENSIDVIDCWLKSSFREATLSLLAQFRPAFQSYRFPQLNRYLFPEEYERVLNYLLERGATNLIRQI